MIELPSGVRHWPGLLDLDAQSQLLAEIREKTAKSPFFTPKMPKSGKEMSVRMTNFGALGWVTDKERGYRYQKSHPVSGDPWPDIPPLLMELWGKLSEYPHLPEACLVNYYEDDAKMGLHQDKDEQVFDAPVLSISLGNECLFRVGSSNCPSKARWKNEFLSVYCKRRCYDAFRPCSFGLSRGGQNLPQHQQFVEKWRADQFNPTAGYTSPGLSLFLGPLIAHGFHPHREAVDHQQSSNQSLSRTSNFFDCLQCLHGS